LAVAAITSNALTCYGGISERRGGRERERERREESRPK
jgi:hypothetical protein